MDSKPKHIFNVTLQEQAAVGTPGVLDQLHLPPALITFLQKNQRTIWQVVIVAAVVITVVSLYSSWRSYRLNKAAEAYDQAIVVEDAQKKNAALQKVAEEYGSAPAGIWSQIALAHLDQKAGKNKEAIAKLTAIEAETSEKSPLKPLLLANLGGLHEQEKDFGKAEALYQKLKGFKGFEPMALDSLGRVYEAMGQKDKAVQMYQQYMGMTEMGKDKKDNAPTLNFPEQEIVQANLNRLLK
ncbi:tetratricopeptide repeat protein [Desulfobulbus sp. F4]|nr:tetratricopeptide repeat protein [Desulfobulbus sp. F3]MCW5200257.1 tetratricopeptide repeat protein [Desulfobulbus sp. F4]